MCIICSTKISDVHNLFNKWRKSNLGVRTGNQLFTELEQRISIYNDTHSNVGGKGTVQRYVKHKDDDGKHMDQPLILALCTPLMSRVHEYIYQSKELFFAGQMDQPLILALCTPLMSRVHEYIYQSKELFFAGQMDQPLILALCTPLMSRVHEYIYQSKELVFADGSSSFEDYNNPVFVLSTSSAAGGLPFGIVLTAESAEVIHKS